MLARESGDVAEPDLEGLLRRADRLRRAGPLGPAGTRESATEGGFEDPPPPAGDPQ